MAKQRIETIFAHDKQVIDVKVLIRKGIDVSNSKIYFDSFLLTGGIESNLPYNECYFGSIDSKNTQIGLDETKPIYYLESNEVNYNTGDFKEALQTLQVFLNDNTFTLLNYSLLDSSLNIKLELLSQESKAILEKEKAQREKQKEQDSKTQDSLSTAMLHPILEDNEIKCPHNGVVIKTIYVIIYSDWRFWRF